MTKQKEKIMTCLEQKKAQEFQQCLMILILSIFLNNFFKILVVGLGVNPEVVEPDFLLTMEMVLLLFFRLDLEILLWMMTMTIL